MMDRRKFCVAALGGLAILPRKSESAQSEEGLSHEQMAQVILGHPHTVFLSGNARCFGFSRTYYYAKYNPGKKDRVEKWRKAVRGDVIDCDYPSEYRRRTKSVGGCVVKICSCDASSGELNNEHLFDISNPLLKVIRLLDTPSRHFARLGEKWVEL